MIYSSWLAFLPVLPVFLGRRSVVQACQRRAALFGARLSMGKRTLVDVGQHTALGDGDVTQQLVQLLIVADGELQVAGDDTGLLVVAGGVASQLENLGSEILEDGSQVDRGTSTDTLGIVALAQETVDTTDGERQAGLRGTTTDGICQRLMIRGGGLEVGTRDRWEESTHDCALLEPLALPPDLPPVILDVD